MDFSYFVFKEENWLFVVETHALLPKSLNIRNQTWHFLCKSHVCSVRFKRSISSSCISLAREAFLFLHSLVCGGIRGHLANFIRTNEIVLIVKDLLLLSPQIYSIILKNTSISLLNPFIFASMAFCRLKTALFNWRFPYNKIVFFEQTLALLSCIMYSNWASIFFLTV